jgi:hypothetical protein
MGFRGAMEDLPFLDLKPNTRISPCKYRHAWAHAERHLFRYAVDKNRVGFEIPGPSQNPVSVVKQNLKKGSI